MLNDLFYLSKIIIGIGTWYVHMMCVSKWLVFKKDTYVCVYVGGGVGGDI